MNGSNNINIYNMHFFMNRIGLGLGLGLGYFGKRTKIVAAAAATAAVVMAAARLFKRHKLQQRLKEHQEHQKRLKQEQESAFEYKYFKEYDELEDDPDKPIPESHIHVRETTPQGDVIMTYDGERGMFCYYCDKRSVQFKYLESVARKYVIEHGCKRLYIDLRKELTKACSKTEKPEKPNAPTTKSIFAQFKKYGTPTSSSNPTPSTTNLTQNSKSKISSNKNQSQPQSQTQTQPQSQPAILKEQVTRYWYCGRLDEFNPQPASETTTTCDFSIIKPIDYASYKKMNS